VVRHGFSKAEVPPYEYTHAMTTRIFAAMAFLTATIAGSQQAPPGSSYDILIRGGRVLDGSGNPWIRADIGIRGDRIVDVGWLPGATAATVIEARDRYVAPGFIDVHSHAAGSLTNPKLREAQALLAQGLTMIVGNPDGGGPTDLREQAERLMAAEPGVNVALMIGHASIRNAVMGQSQRRDPTAEELEKMRALARQGRDDGAFGLSSGLFYQPGRFAKTEEVIALAREAGGVYTSHIRDEGSYDFGVVASVDEVIRIAEEARVRGVVSHMKCLGPDSWGKSATLIDHINAARARGVEVFADQYPYEASSTSLAAATMPDDGARGAKEALASPEGRAKFLTIVKENIRRRGGAKSIVIASGGGAAGLSGKHLEEIAASRGVTPEQAAADIVIAGGASIVSFNMSEDDIAAIMRQAWTMGSTDGGLVLPGPSQPHPRNNGAMARRIARYVRERGTVSLEHAVRTMTSLPARVFGFADRGEIRPRAFADLVIFDLARVQDRATYQRPYELSEGFDWILVNGQIARRDGEFTGIRAGQVLQRQ
jgi:N-acyl-D-amino-acid deacylase